MRLSKQTILYEKLADRGLWERAEVSALYISTLYT
jgi:hypothetical protein